MRHTTVVRGLGFCEGPVVMPDGRIAFVDMRLQSVFVYDGREACVWARTPGSPNGATPGLRGDLYLANNGGIAPDSSESVWLAPDSPEGCIQRLAPDGMLETLAGDLPGPRPHRPNDLRFGPDGWLYFTDPKNWETVQSLTPDETRYMTGAVFRTDCRGMVEVVAEIAGFPNGLAFTPDGEKLVVAQTIRHRLLVLAVQHGGAFGPVEEWCVLDERVNPDGLCFDTRGNLYLAGSASDSVLIISPSRQVVDEIPTGPGSCPTNVALAQGRLWITFGLGGGLGYVDVDAEPLPLWGPIHPEEEN